MKNPFITLTTCSGIVIDINIDNICLYEERTYNDSQDTYTYIVMKSGGSVTRNIREKYETVKILINNYYTQGKIL